MRPCEPSTAVRIWNSISSAGVAFGKLSVSARYTAGFSKIADNVDAKNRTISVMAGLAF